MEIFQLLTLFGLGTREIHQYSYSPHENFNGEILNE